MRLAPLLFLIGFLRPALAQSSCRDISSFDFSNSVITARREARPVFSGAFNGPAPGGPIRLRNGRAFEWDEPAGSSSTIAEADWLECAIWSDNDAHASPARVVSLHYAWSPGLKRYARSWSEKACLWLP